MNMHFSSSDLRKSFQSTVFLSFDLDKVSAQQINTKYINVNNNHNFNPIPAPNGLPVRQDVADSETLQYLITASTAFFF